MRPDILCLVLLFFFFACNKKAEYTKEEFANYIKDPENGIIKMNKADNNVEMKMWYRPYPLVAALMDSGWNKNKGADAPYSYFILSISNNGNELLAGFNSREQFSELLNKLAFQMQDYVSVVTSNKDTVYVADHTMPRTFGMAPTTDIQFAFSSEKISTSDWLEINVKDFGLGIPVQKFKFDVGELKKSDNIVLINN